MDLPAFLAALDERHASYRLDRVREAIMVIVATPGERWEVEFMDGGSVEVERFRTDGSISDGRALHELLTALE